MARTKKTEKITTFLGHENINSSSIITLETPESPQIQDIQEEKTDNYFQSIEEFKAFVKDKFINGSGIAPELFAECVEFVSEQEFDPWGEVRTPIHERLNWNSSSVRQWANWKGKSRTEYRKKIPLFAAFFVNEDGTDWQAIVSIYDKDKDRPYIYLAPSGNGDRVYLPPIPKSIRQKISRRYGVEVPLDGSFWEWLETAKIPRIPTEGGKKALSLLTQGYVGLAMYGCTCGGKEVPIPDLSRFNEQGSTWLFALDRDTKLSTKRKVNASRTRLADVLKNQAIVCIEDIVWNPEQGKGVDDLIVNQGSGAFDLAYAKAFERASKQSTSGGYNGSVGREKFKLPPQAEIVLLLAQKYRVTLKFNDQRNTWMYYSHEVFGVWSEVSDTSIEVIIFQFLLYEYGSTFSSGFVAGIAKLLKTVLLVNKWEEKDSKEFLPFTDGVLNLKTGELLPHDPKYRFTWQLPRPFANDGCWENINKFLGQATCGNAKLKNVLVCFCNAILKGRSELQKFLYLLGKPGAGKGTFLRLIQALIGKENFIVTNLKAWNTNNFEQARAYGKRLVIFPEQTPYADDIANFLSLTGQDPLRNEKKGKDAGDDFIYPGMVVMAGNLYAFSGYGIKPVKRREKLAVFNNEVEESEDLAPLFEPELSAFTAYLLSIPDDEVKTVLCAKDTEEYLDSWETLVSKDPIAAWMDENIVPDPFAQTFMGRNKDECADGGEATTFYGSYANFCKKANYPIAGVNNFSPRFRDHLDSVFMWPFEKVDTSNKGTFLKGVRLRIDGVDNHIPTFSMTLRQKSDKLKQGDISSGEHSAEQSGEPVASLNALQDNDSRDSGELPPETSPENLSSSVVDSNENSGAEVVHPEANDKKSPPPATFKKGDFILVLGKECIEEVTETDPNNYYVNTANGSYPVVDIELANAAANADLLRECVHAQDWEMIEELTARWCKKFKKAVWHELTQLEQQAIEQMKPLPSEVLPVFMEGETYWSESLKAKVMVHLIIDALEECRCTVEGRKGRYSLRFSDIKAINGSPHWELSAGDKVKIISGKKSGTEARISSQLPNQGPVFLKLEGERRGTTRESYWGHQIVKI